MTQTGELNLTPRRGPSIWESGQMHQRAFRPEPWLMGLWGGALVAYGLTRRSLRGVVLTLAGGALAYRAFTGHNDFARAWGWLYGTLCPECQADFVDHSSELSFPASDAPSWTPSGGAQPVSTTH